MLLNASELRNRLKIQLERSDRCWVYSAFLTESGAEFLIENAAMREDERVLVRCSVADVLAGACSLSALSMLIDRNFQVRLSSALHVKLYMFGDVFYVGSSNLTGKGLALSGNSNDELSTEGAASPEVIAVAENLWSQGVELTRKTLEQMQEYVSEVDLLSSTQDAEWPAEIFVEDRDLYCSDFPLSVPTNDPRFLSTAQFRASMAYSWLVRTLEENNCEGSFGYLSSKLHNDVFDDPGPYRREIKGLLSNLLEVIGQLNIPELSVIRPRHRQVVVFNRNFKMQS